MARVAVQADDFDASIEAETLTTGRRDVGAVVTFTGYCRDEQGRLAALEIEHYPGMAEAEIAKVADVAERRWPLLGLRIVHRYGRIAPGGRIVLVAAAAAHRADAFAAASFVMDVLKTAAPFWKREHLTDGGTGAWVEAKGTDEAATRRWGEPLPG